MKLGKIFWRPIICFLLLVLLFSLKTYIAYRIEFNLNIKNSLQEFLLAINPISSTLFLFGLVFLLSGRTRNRVIFLVYFLLSFVLFANIIYYRFFTDFVTFPVLMQMKNITSLGGSTLALLSVRDIFYFADVIILGILLVTTPKIFGEEIKKEIIINIFATALLIFTINLSLAEKDRPQLLTRSFDRNYLVKYIGLYNFHMYDAIQTVKSSSQRVLADGDDITEIENFSKANYNQRNDKYFGQARGMNVIYISLESLQSFMIDYKLNGEEVTPFLNSLVHDKNTFYFDNIFHQTGQGKTSDAEFIMENALFPLPQGAVFMTKSQNTYQALPAILKGNGYTSAAFHGNYKSFWNRELMYNAFGYDYFFDAEYYSMTEDNTINYGMEDKPFFKESLPLLEGLEQPFYAKFITLSNHHPFPLDEVDTSIQPGAFGDRTVNHYFQTSRYMDEALEQFFLDLKAAGLYDNTMFVLYGDHYGISENHNKAMGRVIGEEVSLYTHAQLQRVPLYIHIPGIEGKRISTYGGQVDIRPTVMHLLGIETNDYIDFGTDLLSEEHKQVVPFRNGDFVTKDFTYVRGVCYENETGVEVDKEECRSANQLAKMTLKFSDKLIYGDLLRFYHPSGFTPAENIVPDTNMDNVDMKEN